MPPKSLSASASNIEEFLRQIADSSPQDGQLAFTYAKSIILPATGWTNEEFEKSFTRELALPHNERALARAMESIGKGSFAPFSISLTTSNTAQTAYFLALPRPDKDPAGTPRITTSLAAQPSQMLQPRRSMSPADKENPIFKLLDVLPAYVLLIDKDHCIRFSNRVARQIFGRIDGKTCHQALHTTDAPCSSCPPFRLFGDRSIKVHDWICARTNTAFRTHSYPFETADGALYVLQIGINITAGVRARSALDLSEQRYRSIADNLTIGLALTDQNFKAITLNPKMEQWFGPSAIKGASIADILQNTCCDGGDGPALIFAAVLECKENQESEFKLALHTGEERHFRVVASPILTRTKEIRAIAIMLEDTTDRRDLASRIQQIQRLEALGSLAGGIAHEINQPLSALHLYASGMQMLLEHDPATPANRIQERLSLILSQTDKIRQIINHMRALVMQEENPPLAAVSVKTAVDEALGLVGAQLHDHGITVVKDIPDSLPPVAANAMQLEQVVINLLVNAMHALDSVDKPNKRIRISAEHSENKEIVLRVTDTGPGLGDMHSRVFDPFFTTKEPQQGMGLGLSIVHAFVSSWGGGVEAANRPDKQGAVFTIRIPVPETPPVAAEEDPSL